MLRFVAFLAVFVRHSSYNAWPIISRAGAYGLSLFFLLSGFLITELLQREKAFTGTISFRNFYIRRALRIWPLYYGFLLLALGLGAAIPSYRTQPGYLISFAFMVGNLYVARNGTPNGPIVTLWSISVEEQFYLFWPLLTRLCGLRTLRAIALCVFPISWATIIVLSAHHDSPTVGIWTNSFVEFEFFACGVLLSLGFNGSIPTVPIGGRIALLAAGIGLWLAAARWAGINDIEPASALGLVIGYFGVCVGCVALFLGVYGIRQSWLPGPLLYLGRISYGLYVFHKPCLDLATWLLDYDRIAHSQVAHVIYGIGHIALALIFTVVAAALSYRYCEAPFLSVKKKFSIVRSR